MESIRTSGRNTRGIENITQELANTSQENISISYVRMCQRTRNDSKNNWDVFLTKTHLWVWNFLNQKYQQFWCPQIVKKNLMGCLEYYFKTSKNFDENVRNFWRPISAGSGRNRPKFFFQTEHPPKCVWQQYGPLETIPDGKKLFGKKRLFCGDLWRFFLKSNQISA